MYIQITYTNEYLCQFECNAIFIVYLFNNGYINKNKSVSHSITSILSFYNPSNNIKLANG